jgi:O-antigen/teichoic acid export membrane protein
VTRTGEQTGAPPAGANEGDGASSAAVDYGKTAGFLSIGVGLTGVITYTYFFIASHVLSKPDYGQVTVLWSAVFITVSTLYRPVDQLLSRHISEHLARGETDREPVRVAAKIQCGLALSFLAAALLLHRPLMHGLFEGNKYLYWIYVGAVLFYAASYYARGYLAGHRRFGLFTALILSESCFRTIFAVLVAVGIASGQSAVAVGILAAPALSLMVVPFAFARQARQQPAAAAAPPEGGEEFSLSKGGGFAAAVLLIMFSEQTFLNAGPLIVRSLDGAAAAGFIFNVLMIARAPLQLFQAVSTSLLPHLTSLHHGDEEGSEEAFHHSVRLVILAVVGFAAVVALFVLVAGPALMQLAFSKKFTYDRVGLLLVTLGMGLYLSAVTVNAACLAQGQVRRASVRWISCAAFFIVWCFLPVIANEFRRVEIGFALTAGILLSLLYLIYRRPIERPEDVPQAGTTAELEARLAAADESG